MDNLNNNLLNDEDMECVTGGAVEQNDNVVYQECPKCHKNVAFRVYSGGRAVCPSCGDQVIL